MHKITLQKSQYKQCVDFAKQRFSDSELYKKRGGFKYVDILSGALGEYGVYQFLKNNEIKVNKPDFSIHSKSGKSYEADLTDGDAFFHIKSQTKESAVTYGKSWLLQRNDPILHKPYINHFLVPTIVDVQTGEVTILAIIDLMLLIDKGLIGECKVDWFRKTKVAIYFDALKEGLTEKEMWNII